MGVCSFQACFISTYPNTQQKYKYNEQYTLYILLYIMHNYSKYISRILGTSREYSSAAFRERNAYFTDTSNIRQIWKQIDI